MLDPEYFNDKADRIIEIYRELEDFIMHDIADRMLKSQSVSGTADRMIWKLQQMGESRTEIMNKLSKITGLSRRELQLLLQDAVMTSWDDDLSTFNKIGIEINNPLENAVVMSVMDAEYRKSLGELENLTRTAMNQSNVDLIRMLDEAEIRVASGIQSYSSAICELLDNYARSGVVIDYPTGTRRTLESSVRMCVVTSMNQTSAQITNQYIVEGGIEYVLVSAHLGARIQRTGQPYLAGHENWQGKVYKIRGREPGYPNLLEMTGYDIDESGKGTVVNPLGLHGYNCRHSHKPWDKSLRNPYMDENGNLLIDSDESRELYEKQQKQRAMERSIRKTKRELLMKQEEIDKIAETDVKEILQGDYDRLSYKLRQQNEAYNSYCEKNGLQKQSDRLKVAGFKREQAAKTSGRARAYEHWKASGVKNEGVVSNINMVNEQALISKKSEKNSFSVNMEIVNAKGYHDKFEKLPVSKSAYESAYKQSGRLLDFSDGKEPEHMIAISARNGDLIVDNLSRIGNATRTGFNSEEYGKVLECVDEIILIHNHSHNVRPSGGDIVTYAKYDNIKISLVVCHDGDVFAILSADKSVANIYEEAYNHFRKEFDEDTSKALATQVLYKENVKHNLFEIRRL